MRSDSSRWLKKKMFALIWLRGLERPLRMQHQSRHFAVRTLTPNTHSWSYSLAHTHTHIAFAKPNQRDPWGATRRGTKSNLVIDLMAGEGRNGGEVRFWLVVSTCVCVCVCPYTQQHVKAHFFFPTTSQRVPLFTGHSSASATCSLSLHCGHAGMVASTRCAV